MADLSNMGLDPNVEENSGEFTVLPEGKYKCVIIADRITDNQKGTGKLLELKVQVIEGQHTGTVIIDRLNIRNQNEIAQRIGQGTLKRLCGLTGTPYPPTDTTLMYGKPLMATVKIETFTSNRTGNELKSNKISGYNPVQDVPEPKRETPAKASGVSGW
jgi:hypothetical protein